MSLTHHMQCLTFKTTATENVSIASTFLFKSTQSLNILFVFTSQSVVAANILEAESSKTYQPTYCLIIQKTTI